MKRKKISAFALTILCFSLFLTSCDKKVKLDPKNPTTLNLATYYSSRQLDELEKLTTEFNEGYGFEKGIIVTVKSTASIQKINKYLIDSANEVAGSDEFPDIFITYKSVLPYLKEKKEVINYSDYFSKEELAQYVDNFIKIGTIEQDDKSKIIMLPLGLSTDVTFVNKTDFENLPKNLGITYEAFSNFEDLIEASKKYYNYTDSLTEQKHDGKALYGSDSLAEHIFASMQSMGKSMFVQDKDTYKVNLSKEDARILWNTFYVPIINGYFSKYAKFTSEDMKTGNLLSATASTAGSMYFPEEITYPNGDTKKIQISILKTPGMKNYKKVSLQQGGGIFISKSTPIKEYAASEFVKWLTNKENNTRFALNTSYAPVRKDNTEKDFIENAAKENNIKEISKNSIIMSLQQIKNEDLYIPPIFDNYENIRSLIKDIFDKEIQLKRIELLKRADSGEDYDILISEYTSNSSFDKWYDDIKTRIDKSLKNFK